MRTPHPIISPTAARALLLDGQRLTTIDTRACSAARLYQEIEKLAFVQLDTISVVERAHHHILATRLSNYSPKILDDLHRSGKVFEHMTHDASLIPSRWFPHWRHRFPRAKESTWFRHQIGLRPAKLLNAVLKRIENEGPLMARHFENSGKKGGTWWEWKPAKAALEYLWRCGDLSVAHRVRFQKVYDLTERVLPKMHAEPMPSTDEHINWACTTALERLGVATVREVAAFWNAISHNQAKRWLLDAVQREEIVVVERESMNGKLQPAFAVHNWKKRLEKVECPPNLLRLLSPFDPLIRDRARCLALFNFDYRFEAFVPGPKRKFGYYVLPMLMRDELIGRLDAKLDRKCSVLTINGIWWESGIKKTAATRKALTDGIDRYAQFVGASRWELGSTCSIDCVYRG